MYDSPIFVIGVPRSGTTIFFENFAEHKDLAWVSNYVRIFPRFPALNVLRNLFDNRYYKLKGKKKQYSKIHGFNKYLPRPDEAYNFWDYYSGTCFSKSYLNNEVPEIKNIAKLRNISRKIIRYQSRKRLSAKLTGPPRIRFLSQVFPKAIFIHLIRDGLAVIHSLLNVEFWKRGGGLEKPWWGNGLNDQYIDAWEKSGKDPGVLAAVQWKQIIETSREEAKDLKDSQYIEVKYEDFINEPNFTIHELYRKIMLSCNDKISDHDDNEMPIKSMNEKYKQHWNPTYIRELKEPMEPIYSGLGYGG
jgi:omega-hydroxy-beta-dihydromenaquinone-9 sulfotransferase